MSGGSSTLRNPFKAALREGRRQIGLWQALANAYTTEICAGAGFDWLLFDGEHAPNDIPSLLAQLQAAAPYPVHAIGRPPVGDPHIIKQYLDIGFQTLLMPFVETAEQAGALARGVRYPPFGIRGVAPGLSRAARWGRIADYLDRADDEICLLVQIESVAGIENLDSICAVDGVDGLFIGPADLSAAFGYRGRPGDRFMIERIEDAIRRIVASGKAAGILALDPAFAERCAGLGCTFIGVGTDTGLLARASSELARPFDAASSASRTSTGY
jgi:4-hydroxy-2-oxoheptanedioate aldolase